MEQPQAQPQAFLPTGDPTDWINPICVQPSGDCKTSFLGCCLPCVLYGKTQNRLRAVRLGEDPLDETEFNSCNNRPCWIHLVACGFITILGIPNWSGGCTFTQHNRIRETYNIKGDTKMDLAKSICLNQCTLMQADREVRSRAALDEKAATDGIFVRQYSTGNQMMRYVPDDALFQDILESRRGSLRPTPSRTSVNGQPDNRPEMAQTLDGVSTPPGIALGHLSPKVHAAAQSIMSTDTVRRSPQVKAQNASPPGGKVDFMNKCENHGIVVKESNKLADNGILNGSHSDQGNTESENTVIQKQGSDHATGEDGQTVSNGGPDETVFVYYTSPTTPQPQKLRDCVKTNTSESLADCKVTFGKNRTSTTSDSLLDYKEILSKKRTRSSSRRTDSCEADEEFSYEEPSIQAMLRIENVDPSVSFPAITSGNNQSTTQLSKITEITESIPEEQQDAQNRVERSSSQSMMVNLSDRSDRPHGTHGSEDTITEARYSGDKPTQSGPSKTRDTEYSDYFDEEAAPSQLHPKTRESNIMPSTPLALEEVLEEINVEGEWKVPQEGKAGAMTMGAKFGRKVRPSFFDGNSEP